MDEPLNVRSVRMISAELQRRSAAGGAEVERVEVPLAAVKQVEAIYEALLRERNARGTTTQHEYPWRQRETPLDQANQELFLDRELAAAAWSYETVANRAVQVIDEITQLDRAKELTGS